MTGAEIKELFESLIDDTIDETFAYSLMNIAKDEIESERDWEFLKKLDTSKTRSSGDTYDTAKALPTDFLSPLKLYVGDDLVPWNIVPFESKLRNKSLPFCYWLDIANSNFYLSGSAQETSPIYFYYIYETADIAAATSPVWPGKLHSLLAFKMADLVEAGIDGDDLNFRMSAMQRRQFEILHNNMKMWDAKIKAKAQEHANDNYDTDNISGIISNR